MSIQKNVVCCFGDSITQGSSDAVRAFPSRLQSLLGYQWSVFNHGIGGENASEIGTRVNLMDDKFTGAPIRIAVLFGGINDIVPGTSAADTYTDLLASVTALLNGGWDHVIWLTPTPALPYAEISAGELIELQSLCAMILAYTNDDVTVFDLYSHMEDTVTADTMSYQGGGGKPDYVTSAVSPFAVDRVHPNDTGQAAIAAVVYQLILAI